MCGPLLGCTVHMAHFEAAAATVAHDGVQRVISMVHVQGGTARHGQRSDLAAGPPPLGDQPRSPRNLFADRGSDQAPALGDGKPEVLDPAPPGNVLQLVWERLPEED